MATDTDQPDGAGSREDDQTGRQMSFTVLASIVGMALRYVSAVLTTRVLGAALFGSYVQAQTITQLLSTSATLGLSPGVVPFVARERLAEDVQRLRGTVRATLAVALVSSVLIAAALLLLAPWLAGSVFDDPALEQVLRWLAPMVVLAALLLTTLAVVQGFKAMRVHAFVGSVVTVVATLAGLVVTVSLDFGLHGVLVATLLGPATGLACGLWFIQAHVPGALRPSAPSAPWPVRSLVTTCWPLLGTGLITFALSSLDILMLGVLSQSGEVGVYGAAARLLPAVFVVHMSAAQLFYAHASERYVAGDMQGVGALYKRTGRWSIWSALGTAMLMVIWGREILGLFGPEFAAGGSVLAVLALGHAAVALTGSCGKALIAMGRLRQNMCNVATMLVLNVALNFLWIPEHGALGAAFATLAARAFVRLAQALQVWWSYRIHPWSPDSAVAMLAAGVAYVAAQPVRQGFGGSYGWLISMAAFGAAWLGLYLAFGVSKEDRAAARRLLLRRR